MSRLARCWSCRQLHPAVYSHDSAGVAVYAVTCSASYATDFYPADLLESEPPPATDTTEGTTPNDDAES